MDYDYSGRETVKLDCKTERAICEIKDTLKQVAHGLDNLTRKLDELANKEPVEAQDK